MPELFTQPIFIDNEGFKLDEAGSLIAGVHIDADKAYSELPDLLQKFINTQNEEVCSEIEKKIDYIYSGIFIMLNYLDEETNFMCKLQEEVKKNKILLFKPNIVYLVIITVQVQPIHLQQNGLWLLQLCVGFMIMVI